MLETLTFGQQAATYVFMSTLGRSPTAFSFDKFVYPWWYWRCLMCVVHSVFVFLVYPRQSHFLVDGRFRSNKIRLWFKDQGYKSDTQLSISHTIHTACLPSSGINVRTIFSAVVCPLCLSSRSMNASFFFHIWPFAPAMKADFCLKREIRSRIGELKFPQSPNDLYWFRCFLNVIFMENPVHTH